MSEQSTCRACGGSGKCGTCDGTGRQKGWEVGGSGGQKACDKCNGTGSCQSCKGSGHK